MSVCVSCILDFVFKIYTKEKKAKSSEELLSQTIEMQKFVIIILLCYDQLLFG